MDGNFKQKLRILEETIISLRKTLFEASTIDARCGNDKRDHIPYATSEISKAIIAVSNDIANLKDE